MSLILLILALFLLILTPDPAVSLSNRGSFEITAHRLELLQGGDKLLAEGDVVLEGRDFLLYAKRAIYDRKTDWLELFNFRIFDFTQNATIYGDQAFFDLRNNELYADKIFIYLKREGFRIKAWDFQKNALNEYRAKRAVISACEFDCEGELMPPWSLEVIDFFLTPEGDSTARKTLFKVGKQTLLSIPEKPYLPGLNLPIFFPRKRGFLLPNLSQGNRFGLGFQLPYFFPITDQLDFTISPLFTTKRGFLWDFEGQFALTKNNQGIFRIRYLNDYNKPESPSSSSPKHRYWITGKIDVIPRETLDIHLDFDLLSDRYFLEEFNIGEGSFDRSRELFLQRFMRDLEDKSQEYRTSRLWLQYVRNSLYSRIQSSYFDYVGGGNKREILQPLVGLHFRYLPTSLREFLVGIGLDYQYFYRKENYYGNRLATTLEISYPFTFSILRNSATLTYKGFVYLLEDIGNFSEKSLYQNLFEVNLTTYTLLGRNYYLGTSGESLTFKHILKPYITFSYRTSSPDRSQVPQFSLEDYLVKKEEAMEYGLWQFIHLASQRNFLVLRTYQRYDFTKAKRAVLAIPQEERALSDLYFQLLSQWMDKFSFRYDTAYNFYGLGFKKHAFTLALRDYFINQINLTYQEDTAWKTRQLILTLAHSLTKNLGLRYYISRNLIKDETTEQRLEALWLHDCYFLGFGVTATPSDTKFYFRIELRGIGGIGEKIQPLL